MWVVLLLVLVTACGRAEVAPAGAGGSGVQVREHHAPPGALALPLKSGSIRFAVIGDSGRGDAPQHQVAAQMAAWRLRFPFDFVLMLGDNIYDRHTAQDYVDKFTRRTRRCSARA